MDKSPAKSPTTRAAKGPGEHYTVDGALTFDTVRNWLALPEKWTPGTDPITVDLGPVTKADSAGLALLIEWQRSARARGRPLVFTHIPAKLQDLIRVSGLSELFLTKRAV